MEEKDIRNLAPSIIQDDDAFRDLEILINLKNLNNNSVRNKDKGESDFSNLVKSITEVRGFKSNNFNAKKDDSVFKSTGTMFGSVATIG